MAKVSGSCLCGAIKYTSTAEPVMAAVCHCTHCQKQAGSAFSVVIGVPKGSLKITSGKTTVYSDKGDSGKAVNRHFCATCGSPIYSDVESSPQLDWIKAGTLDDTSWVKPTVNIWCQSAQNWIAYPEGAAKFPRNPSAG